jgi:hypothetical protein
MSEKFKEVKTRLISELKKLGYRLHNGIGYDLMERKLYPDKEWYGLIGYSCSDYGISIEWDLMLRGDNNILKYIACTEYDIPLAFQLDKQAEIIFHSILTWSNNQLVFSWPFHKFDGMVNFINDTDEYLSKRYQYVENIIEDMIKDDIEVKEIYKKNGKVYGKAEERGSHESFAIVYAVYGMKDQAIEHLSKAIGYYKTDTRYLTYAPPYCLQRKEAYLDYLKHDTPLPYIPSPADKASLFQLTSNDIYIALNKKNIKDNDILEYFGSKEIFDKPQKISYKDLNNDNGIAICKVGKWSILRIGVDLFMQFDQSKIENMLSDMSTKFNRAFLCVNQDITNTFGFEAYKKGEFLRRWMAGDGEVLENIGKPITGEKKRFNDTLKDEQDAESVVIFLDSVLKITYGDLEKSKTVLYEIK